VLEGRVVIHDCGCWAIFRYSDNMVQRFQGCAACIEKGLVLLEKLVQVDTSDSVSALGDGEKEPWLI